MITSRWSVILKGVVTKVYPNRLSPVVFFTLAPKARFMKLDYFPMVGDPELGVD